MNIYNLLRFDQVFNAIVDKNIKNRKGLKID